MERLAEIYHDLIRISDTGADIYASEICLEFLRVVPHPETALLRMQLEQERFFHLLASNDACEALRERLSPYTAVERRGILLYMLEELDSLQGAVWTEHTRLLTAHTPLSQLEVQTASTAESIAQQFCTDIIVPPVTTAPAERSAAAAALAAAAYVSDPSGVPEQLAAVTAAATAGHATLLTLTLLFQLLTPFRREQTASIQAQLLSLLALFLTCLSLLTGSAVTLPTTLPVLTKPEIPEKKASVLALESASEEPECETEQQFYKERA